MVGVGMATTIAISFLPVIPVEPVAWLLGPLGAILVGYYASSRVGRLHGSWGWGEQLRTAGIVILLTTLGGPAGGALYGLVRPTERPPA